MKRHWLIAAIVLLTSAMGLAQEPAKEKEPPAGGAASRSKLTPQDLADWIDERFEAEYKKAGVTPAEAVDDATFLRRAFLDLQGRIPTVAQTREFLDDSGSFKRQDYVD